jgi:hypothetical protein
MSRRAMQGTSQQTGVCVCLGVVSKKIHKILIHTRRIGRETCIYSTYVCVCVSIIREGA